MVMACRHGEKSSIGLFRSTDLWVMSPTRSHCATMLPINNTHSLNNGWQQAVKPSAGIGPATSCLRSKRSATKLGRHLSKRWVGVSNSERKIATNEPRASRTPNLLIWSQTRCHCAIGPTQDGTGGLEQPAAIWQEKLSEPGFEPGSRRPQRLVLTPRRFGLSCSPFTTPPHQPGFL